jgi:4-amino-4-deoxy-L-arabinose transferase-like glycosyltransferase
MRPLSGTDINIVIQRLDLKGIAPKRDRFLAKRREVLLILAILVLGVALRLVFVVQHGDIGIAFDQKFYHRQATALAEGGTLPEEYVVRPPVYAGFLAVITRIIGPDVNGLRITQACLSSVLLVLFYLFARKFLGPAWSLLAVSILALHPSSIIEPWLLLTEFVFTPLLLIAIGLALNTMEEPGRKKWFIASAVFWALAALTRAVAAGYFALILVVFFGMSQRVCITRKTALLAALAFLVVLSPWTIRNHARYGGLMPIGNTAAFNLWLTNTPGIRIQDFSRNYWQKIENPVKRQQIGLHEGMRAIRSDPAYYAKRCGKRFSKFWSAGGLYPTIDVRDSTNPRNASLYRRILDRVQTPVYWAILVPALVGMGISLRKRRLLILSGFVIYLTLVHSLLVANARHRSPLTPLLIILAVFGVAEVVRWIRTGRKPEAVLQ